MRQVGLPGGLGDGPATGGFVMKSTAYSSLARAAVFGAALVGMSVLASAPAQANTVTLSLADLAGFSQLASSDTAGTTSAPVYNSGFEVVARAFTTVFDSSVLPGYQTATIGSTGLNVGYDIGDTFRLVLSNNNENPWNFELLVNDVVAIASHSLVNGTSEVLAYALPGAGVINSIKLVVGANVPQPLGDGTFGDYTAEYTLAPVPLPAGLALLGTGVLGLGLMARRKKSKDATAAVAA
jgi:hypothetical protein